MIDACGKAVLIEKAEDWSQKLEDSGLKPNMVTYNSMIDVCGKVVLIDKVEDCFQKLEANGLKPNSGTYNSMIDVVERWASLTRLRTGSRSLRPMV